MAVSTLEKIQEIGSRLLECKNSSLYVKDFCIIMKEIRSIKSGIEKTPNSTLFVIKKSYLALLEEKVEELKEIEDVKRYISISSEFSEITEENSKEMKSLKRKNPELYSWIAMNQKRAVYEKLVEEEPQRYNRHYEILQAVKRNILEFRKQHRESVDEWEKLYKIKHLISTYSE